MGGGVILAPPPQRTNMITWGRSLGLLDPAVATAKATAAFAELDLNILKRLCLIRVMSNLDFLDTGR